MDNKKKGYDTLTLSLRVLNQIGASILSELTVEEIIDTVYRHVNQLIDAYSLAIGIYNSASNYIQYIERAEILCTSM